MNKILVSFALALLLSACNSDSNPETPTSSDSKAKTDTSVAALLDTAKPDVVNINTETANAQIAVADFAGNLKAKLMEAMQSSGPMKALSVCNHKVPAITAHLADVYGKQLSRVSLKYRNSNNRPDDWQRTILEDFEARKALGEDANKMVYAEIVTKDNKRQFRFMQAIVTEDRCLICHGKNISPKLKKRITKLYPNDQAVDYEQGDIRGAFVVVNNLAD